MAAEAHPAAAEDAKMAGQSPAAAPKTPKTPSKDAGFPYATVARMLKEGAEHKVSSEAVHTVSKATELFLEHLVVEAHRAMEAGGHKVLAYSHLAKAVNGADKLQFLSEVVPEKEPASRFMAKGLQ